MLMLTTMNLIGTQNQRLLSLRGIVCSGWVVFKISCICDMTIYHLLVSNRIKI